LSKQLRTSRGGELRRPLAPLAPAVIAMPRSLLIAGLLFAAGCHAPLVHVAANGQLNADATLDAAAQVSAMFPPSDTVAGPVEPALLPHRPRRSTPNRIAVLDVDGLLVNTDMTGLGSLGENPVSLFRERLDAIAADPCVCAVVLRVNSPGGGVTATDIMWHDLQTFKSRIGVPVVACLMDVGTGGGYYLATAADQIVAHPTTVTGGIGVILNVYNLQDAMAQFNIVGAPIKAGKNIDIGTPIVALDEDRRKLLQRMADEFHQRFRKVVLEARHQVDPNLASTFDGRVFTATQAHELGLIDTVGYLDDAVRSARQLAQAPDAPVVFFHRPNDPALSPYATTPNTPLQGSLLPLSLPGLDRSRLPSFLYLWQPEPTMEKLSGR